MAKKFHPVAHHIESNYEDREADFDTPKRIIERKLYTRQIMGKLLDWSGREIHTIGDDIAPVVRHAIKNAMTPEGPIANGIANWNLRIQLDNALLPAEVGCIVHSTDQVAELAQRVGEQMIGYTEGRAKATE